MGWTRRNTLKTLVTSYEDCPVDIPKKEYLDIVEGFMKFLMEKVHNSEHIRLPAGMGDLSITGTKQRVHVDEAGTVYGLAVDWKNTLKLWKENPEAKEEKRKIYLFNEHTKGIRYKFRWVKYSVPMPYYVKMPYYFKATREHKRRVWKSILAGKEYFIKPPVSKENVRTIQKLNQKRKKN